MKLPAILKEENVEQAAELLRCYYLELAALLPVLTAAGQLTVCLLHAQPFKRSRQLRFSTSGGTCRRR